MKYTGVRERERDRGDAVTRWLADNAGLVS